VIHVGIFLVFGLLVYRALEPRIQTVSLNWKRLLLAVAIVVFYGVSDELHQGLVPGRTLDVKDVTADAVGGILSAVLVYFDHKRKSQKNRPE
jgi:VanZ family protein